MMEFSSRRSSLTQTFVESCVNFELAHLSVLMIRRLPHLRFLPYSRDELRDPKAHFQVKYLLKLSLKWTKRFKMWEKYSEKELAEIGMFVCHYGGSTAARVLQRSWVGV